MIDAAGSIWQIFAALIIFVAGAIALFSMSTYFKSTKKRTLFIYVWHSIWCFVYCLYSLHNSADSLDYFLQAEYMPSMSVGSPAVILLTHILRVMLGLSYVGVFLIFNIFGALGLLAFDSSIRNLFNGNPKGLVLLARLIVFLPGLSFWTSAIGKDSIAFMATGFLIWAWVGVQKRYFLAGLSISTMFIVRPHIAIIALTSIFISILFDVKIRRIYRLLNIGILMVVIGALYPIAMEYTGLSFSTLSDIESYILFRRELNVEGGAALDLSEMLFFAQVLSYLFRPFFFDASNLLQVAASLENLVLVIFFFKFAFNVTLRSICNLDYRVIFLSTYSISCLLLLSITTANLGIAVRQKWLFLPMMILYVLAVTSNSVQRKTSCLEGAHKY